MPGARGMTLAAAQQQDPRPPRPLALHCHALPLSPCKPGLPLGCRDVGSHRCWVQTGLRPPLPCLVGEGVTLFWRGQVPPSQLTPSDLPRPVQELWVLGPVVLPSWVLGPVMSPLWVQWDQSWPQCRDWGVWAVLCPRHAQRWGERAARSAEPSSEMPNAGAAAVKPPEFLYGNKR